METLTELIDSKQMPSRKEKSILLLVALAPFVPFVPLALWAHGHPVNRLDVKIAQEIQKEKGPFLNFIVLAGLSSHSVYGYG